MMADDMMLADVKALMEQMGMSDHPLRKFSSNRGSREQHLARNDVALCVASGARRQHRPEAPLAIDVDLWIRLTSGTALEGTATLKPGEKAGFQPCWIANHPFGWMSEDLWRQLGALGEEAQGATSVIALIAAQSAADSLARLEATRPIIVARIRRVADGLERDYEYPALHELLEPGTTVEYHESYMWAEGNFACDCNRALFFARAAGEERPEEPPCGDDERFVVLSLTRKGAAEPFWTPETNPWA